MYGNNCSMPCGQCKKSSYQRTCMNGWGSGYQGVKCSKSLLIVPIMFVTICLHQKICKVSKDIKDD